MSQIFEVGHEAGDLSEYSSTVTDSGDLSVSAAAALAGSAYGLDVLIDGTGAIYGRIDFSTLTSGVYRFRCYIDPNGLTMASGDQFRFLKVAVGGSDRALLRLNYNGSDYRLSGLVKDDATSNQTTSHYVITDGPHYVEAMVEYASSDVAIDAKFTLWVDGVQQEQVTGLDIYDITQPDSVRIGAVTNVDAGTTGTLYLDGLILRDDAEEIGEGAAHYFRPVLGLAVPVRQLRI